MLKIVTDSTCGLTQAEAEELGVIVLPMQYVVDGVRHDEKPQGENGDYEKLFSHAQEIATEPVYPAHFAEVFRQLLNEHDDVLCITMSGRLSGVYRAACDARDAVIAQTASEDLDAHLRLVDSRLTVAALEQCLRYARRLADENKSLEEIAQAVEQYRDEVRIAFAVPDMKPLRKSGRLGATHRSVMRLLDRWPVFSLDAGGIRSEGSGKGSAGAARALINLVESGAHEVIISTFGASSEPIARNIMIELRRRFPHTKVLVKDGGPVIASHIGTGAVSITWVATESLSH